MVSKFFNIKDFCHVKDFGAIFMLSILFLFLHSLNFHISNIFHCVYQSIQIFSCIEFEVVPVRYPLRLREEYQAEASTGVRVKVMNFQKKHENLLYPLGCY